MNEGEAESPPRPTLCKEMCPAGEFCRRRRQKRQKRLELDPDRQPALCKEMCPAGEFCRRRRQKRLHRLKLDPDRQPDPARAVKEFSRPAAGQAPPPPCDLRPLAVLLATVHHLLGRSVAEASEVSPAERCGCVQSGWLWVCNARPPRLAPPLLYLLHAGARLCNQAPARFDAHLHDGQLRETLAALRRAYRRPDAHPAQPRFQAL